MLAGNCITESFDWLVMKMNLKVKCRSVLEDNGEQCVMIFGEIKMLYIVICNQLSFLNTNAMPSSNIANTKCSLSLM